MRYPLIALLLACAVTLAGCDGSTTNPDSTQPVADTPADPPAPPPAPGTFPDSKAVGDACEASCPNGDDIGITCAAGETPICDCDATPRTECAGSEAS